MAFLQEYTMLDELGKGGYATVYKVRHNELGYIRAVRVLNETVVDANSEVYRKFLRECKVLLRLGNGNHPNIVHIYQPRLLDNKALVEQDYVNGQDVTHFIKKNNNFVPVEEVIRMALQISSALAYCHEDIYRFCMDRDEDGLLDDPNDGSKVLMDDNTRRRLIAKYKVIHNDIHSGNIMRREDGNFVLLDFGLAINGDEVVRSSRHTNGAPEYKAPEKWDDESALTEQSDIYSFGVVLYECLAGRVPFPYDKRITNKTEAEYLLNKAHKSNPVPSIEEQRRTFFEKNNGGETYTKDYPQWIEDVILKCLNKNPSDRFRNGKELYDAIVSGVAQTDATSDGDRMETDSIINDEIESPVAKWKKACAVVLLLLLAVGGYCLYPYAHPDSKDEIINLRTNIDSLLSVNNRLQMDKDSLMLAAQASATEQGTELETLRAKYKTLLDDNDYLKGVSQYQGHDAKYWYGKGLYSGHDARYWYENRLYKGKDAKYWYEKYMGY